MLLSLTITDFVLVDRLALDFGAGFSVLTGETGAGKSILLDALSLVLGGRADAGVVRGGAARAEVSAEFAFDRAGGLAAWLDDNDLAGEADGVLLRRVVEAGGRSRAYINGRPATAQQLKAAGDLLVDIHGQHDHYSLLKPAEQRRLLDAFAGCGGLAQSVARAWDDWGAARARRAAALARAGELDAERARLAWTVDELAGLDFRLEDWQPLQDEHRRLTHAAELARGAQAAADALAADEAGLMQQLARVRAALAGLAAIDPRLNDQHALLDSAADLLTEAARELGRYAGRVDLDPQALNQAEARIAAIQAMARKHRLRPDELPAHLDAARARLAELGEAADLDALATAEAAAQAAYQGQAEALTARRRQAAARLGDAVTGVMQQLAMKGGRFEPALLPREPAAHGLEDIEFQVAPHQGQDPRPLARTASGGELSRIGLALQTVLSGVSGAASLIFDEVDAGVGGGVAEVVGRMLAALGETRQVLCVTHLPQVAARAGGHYRVSKESRDGHARTAVVRLEGEGARVEEVARMLGGVTITDTTRRHALELLGG